MRKFANHFMDKFRKYDIEFSGLKLGKHCFEMDVEQQFFDLFDFEQEFKTPKIDVFIDLNKHSSFLELNLKTKGTVELECDLSEELFSQPVENQLKILVKFGEEFDDSNEEVLIIPMGSHSVNVAQLIYESTLLSIPMKHIHPRYQNGKTDEYSNLLEKYSIKENEDTSEEEV